ncbi:FAD-dependent oxidoreductase [Candidatus Peregrinibacteria bacterium]|nr:FAD-dependent oxidoreductase [Candidatus Peregrinibacteria bacterium]
MYDVVIIGSGAAGYAAAIYSVRYKLKTLVIGSQEGGQTAQAHDVENYPGFISIKGPELMKKFREHAIEYGVEVQNDEVTEIIQNSDGTFTLKRGISEATMTRSLILTVGTKTKKLGALGEKELDGKGITYCATCDGFFFRNKVTAIIGGGDSAATAALYLADLCPKVYLIVRKEKMRAEPIWVGELEKRANIQILYNSEVKQFHGTQKLEKIELTNGTLIEDVVGAFVEIGSTPNTTLVDKFGLEKDKGGFLIVNKDQSTAVRGLYAAGDVTNLSNHFHQIATAIGEGSIAANSVFEYLSSQKK